jgi:flagellar biosynthesis/type III secretory pathway ATPase
LNEPIADAVRSILDGHIVLSRALAAANQYPAIDVLGSISRVMPDVVSEEHRRAASAVRDLMATYREHEDLVNIGAYIKGSNPRVDAAILRIEAIRGFLRQDVDERADYEETLSMLRSLV